MARASTRTKLPIDTWAAIFGIHPLHLNQIQVDADANSICEQAWFEHEWQDSDRVGREALAVAIAQAESDIEEQLGFRLVPSWERDEWHAVTRPYHPEFVNLSGTDTHGYRSAVGADWGYFIAGGIEQKDLLQAGAAVAYAAATGSFDDTSYPETATVVVTVAQGAEPCEVAVYYPGKGGDDAWEIRPINVVVSGTTATITFRRELAVLEGLQEDLRPHVLDGLDDTNFLTTVDVYHHWNNPQQQATMVWEPLPGCGCNTSGCVSCSQSVQTACTFGRGEPRLSIVAYAPADWDPTALAFTPAAQCIGRDADALRLYYYAGQRDNGQNCANVAMNRDWARTVAYYAASFLDRPLCGCTALNQQIQRWTQDLAFETGADETGAYKMSDSDLDNPLGTRRGAVYAWRRILRGRHGAIGQAVRL